MNEMIDEIKGLVVKKGAQVEIIMILDVLATMAQRIEQLENRVADKGAANGSSKKESGLNIG